MSTLIIGTDCTEGVVLAADRRELRGHEPSERGKIRQIMIGARRNRVSVLLAGAGIAAFWDEVSWSLPRLIKEEGESGPKSLLDVVDRISSLSINLSARYQRDGLDERLGCVVAGLEDLSSGKAQIFYFAGAGFSSTDFVCLGSGDRYALPMADALLHQRLPTVEEAVQVMPFLFLLTERVNVSVGGGPDILVVEHGRQPKAVLSGDVERARKRSAAVVQSCSDIFLRELRGPGAVKRPRTKRRSP